MKFLNFDSKYIKDVYKLYCDFRDEDNFYKELSFEEFEKLLFKNGGYQEDGTFMCLDGDKLVGFVSSLCRASDDNNPNASGYIHTFIVKKEYRRQGIGSKLLELVETRMKERGRGSSRCVFLGGIYQGQLIPLKNTKRECFIPFSLI